MPLRLQPSSLRQSALRAVCQKFNQLFYGCDSEDDMRLLIESGAYLEVENPLHDLPPNMLEDLAAEMRHLTYLRSHHLHMTMTESLQEWTTAGTVDLMMAFHLLSTRCKKLKHLTLAYVRHMNLKLYLNLVPSLANIVTLDLRETMIVDEVVNRVGEFCKVLVDLNLSGTPITDKGLVQLCVSQSGQSRCQRLARLSVSETWISATGAAVVLYFLPNLRDFDYDNIFEAVEYVEMWTNAELTDKWECLLARAGVRHSDLPVRKESRLRLATLSSTAEHLREEALESAVRLCPDATNVTIANSWLPNESLYKLMMMENLSSLSLTNSEGCTFTFEEGVMPVLSVCGARLHSLILSNFPEVKIAGVGGSCPNLRNLAFANVPVFDLPSQQPQSNCEWFAHLEALELWSVSDVGYSPHLIRQLLINSPRLKNLLFNSCNVLTDELIIQIMQMNPLERLSHLTLNHCDGVTMTTINYILDAKNDLNVLRIWSCASITRVHSEEISNYIGDHNLNMYFEWFQYD